MTPHEQTRKPDRPKLQIPHRQRTDMLLDRLGHVLIMILLVPQRSQQVQHFRTGVLALLAERVFEVLGQVFEEVHVRAEHAVGDGLEDLQAG